MNGRLCKTEWVVLKYGHLYVSDFTGKKDEVFDIRLTEDEQRAFKFDTSQTFRIAQVKRLMALGIGLTEEKRSRAKFIPNLILR